MDHSLWGGAADMTALARRRGSERTADPRQ